MCDESSRCSSMDPIELSGLIRLFILIGTNRTIQSNKFIGTIESNGFLDKIGSDDTRSFIPAQALGRLWSLDIGGRGRSAKRGVDIFYGYRTDIVNSRSQRNAGGGMQF